METALLDQTRLFVYASAAGIGLGLLYDILSLFPDLFGKRVLRPLFDILYCLVFMTVFIVLLQAVGGGVMRWYLPGGIILGLCLYFFGFSDYVKMALAALERLLLALWKVTLKIIEKISVFFDHPWGC